MGATLDDLGQRLQADALSPDEISTTCDLLFAAAEAGSLIEIRRAAAMLLLLGDRHGMRCDVSFARRAAVVVGSMILLQSILVITPDLNCIGEDIFDKKYPKFSLQDLGKKNCVRCLLARGMRLGSSNNIPASKLLRKVEADAAPEWARRWLDAMTEKCPLLPDQVRSSICSFLG